MSEPVFVDTSALYAALDATDANAPTAVPIWARLLNDVEVGTIELFTHSSVIVESVALVQRRLGMPATRVLVDEFVRLMTVVWIDAELHARATTALLAANRRDVSLVDWTSFEVMRERTMDVAFAFDEDFSRQGFTVLAA
ncbi:MAG TPA: PIN domain-containing protein [Ilumatobacteraceae bacterium]|nr:PIN domain-containing protein [Ilumatobacteraceae bacterium]